MSSSRRAVLLNKAVKDKKIGKEVREKYFKDASTMESVENDMARLGYDPNGIGKLVGYNSKILKAQRSGDPNELKNSQAEFYGKFDQKDWANILPDSFLDEKIKHIIMANLLANSAGSLSKILSNTKKGEDVKTIVFDAKITAEGMDEKLRKKVEDSVEKSLAKRFFEFEDEKEEKKEEKNEEKKK
jgi:hypothetical protein